MYTYLKFYIFVIISLLILGCSDSTSEDIPENNISIIYSLEFISPQSGEQILLAGEEKIITIKMKSSVTGGVPNESPIENEGLNFQIKGQAGGAILSKNSAVTNNEGKVSFSIIAGKTPAQFTISIENSKCIELVLEVTVTQSGLVSYNIQLEYDGDNINEINSIELGIIYDATCTIGKVIQETYFKNRFLTDTSDVEYNDLPIDIPFIIAARGRNSLGEVIVTGCYEPSPEVLIPDSRIDITISLSDLVTQFGGPWEIVYDTFSTSVSSHLYETYSHWSNVGGCQFGIASLYIDCLVSYMENGDLTTCSEGIETTQSSAIKVLRGIKDATGCRGEQDINGFDSLEYKFHILSPQIVEIQQSFSQFKSLLEQNSFDNIKLFSKWEQKGQQILHSIEYLSFPEISDSTYLVSERYSSDSSMLIGYEVDSDTITIEEHGFKIGIVDTINYYIWESIFSQYNVVFDGEDISFKLVEEISSANNGYPYESIISITENHAESFEVEQAFYLLGSYLNNGWFALENNDLTITGTIETKDPDHDNLIDSVVPSLNVIIYPKGKPVVE
jgi:hypothetical protein